MHVCEPQNESQWLELMVRVTVFVKLHVRRVGLVHSTLDSRPGDQGSNLSPAIEANSYHTWARC
jgi:hypothetical protein